MLYDFSHPPLPRDAPIENIFTTGFVTDREIPIERKIRICIKARTPFSPEMVEFARKMYKEGQWENKKHLKYHLSADFFDPAMIPLPGFEGWEYNPDYPNEFPRQIKIHHLIKNYRRSQKCNRQRKRWEQLFIENYLEKSVTKHLQHFKVRKEAKKLSRRVRKKPGRKRKRMGWKLHEILMFAMTCRRLLDFYTRQMSLRKRKWLPWLSDEEIKKLKLKIDFKRFARQMGWKERMRKELTKNYPPYLQKALEWIEESSHTPSYYLESELTGDDLKAARAKRERMFARMRIEAKRRAHQRNFRMNWQFSLEPNNNQNYSRIKRELDGPYEERYANVSSNVFANYNFLSRQRRDAPILMDFVSKGAREEYEKRCLTTSSGVYLGDVKDQLMADGVSYKDVLECMHTIDDMIGLVVCQEIIPQMAIIIPYHDTHRDRIFVEVKYNELERGEEEDMLCDLWVEAEKQNKILPSDNRKTMFALLSCPNYVWSVPLKAFLEMQLNMWTVPRSGTFRYFTPPTRQPIDVFKVFLTTNMDLMGKATQTTDRYEFYFRDEFIRMFKNELQRHEHDLILTQDDTFFSQVLNKTISNPYLKHRVDRATRKRRLRREIEMIRGRFVWREKPIDWFIMPKHPRMEKRRRDEMRSSGLTDRKVQKARIGPRVKMQPKSAKELYFDEVARTKTAIFRVNKIRINIYMHEDYKKEEIQKIMSTVDVNEFNRLEAITMEPKPTFKFDMGPIEKRIRETIAVNVANVERLNNTRGYLTYGMYLQALKDAECMFGNDGASTSDRHPACWKEWTPKDYKDIPWINNTSKRAYWKDEVGSDPKPYDIYNRLTGVRKRLERYLENPRLHCEVRLNENMDDRRRYFLMSLANDKVHREEMERWNALKRQYAFEDWSDEYKNEIVDKMKEMVEEEFLLIQENKKFAALQGAKTEEERREIQKQLDSHAQSPWFSLEDVLKTSAAAIERKTKLEEERRLKQIEKQRLNDKLRKEKLKKSEEEMEKRRREERMMKVMEQRKIAEDKAKQTLVATVEPKLEPLSPSPEPQYLSQYPEPEQLSQNPQPVQVSPEPAMSEQTFDEPAAPATNEKQPARDGFSMEVDDYQLHYDNQNSDLEKLREECRIFVEAHSKNQKRSPTGLNGSPTGDRLVFSVGEFAYMRFKYPIKPIVYASDGEDDDIEEEQLAVDNLGLEEREESVPSQSEVEESPQQIEEDIASVPQSQLSGGESDGTEKTNDRDEREMAALSRIDDAQYDFGDADIPEYMSDHRALNFEEQLEFFNFVAESDRQRSEELESQKSREEEERRASEEKERAEKKKKTPEITFNEDELLAEPVEEDVMESADDFNDEILACQRDTESVQSEVVPTEDIPERTISPEVRNIEEISSNEVSEIVSRPKSSARRAVEMMSAQKVESSSDAIPIKHEICIAPGDIDATPVVDLEEEQEEEQEEELLQEPPRKKQKFDLDARDASETPVESNPIVEEDDEPLVLEEIPLRENPEREKEAACPIVDLRTPSVEEIVPTAEEAETDFEPVADIEDPVPIEEFVQNEPLLEDDLLAAPVNEHDEIGPSFTVEQLLDEPEASAESEVVQQPSEEVVVVGPKKRGRGRPKKKIPACFSKRWKRGEEVVPEVQEPVIEEKEEEEPFVPPAKRTRSSTGTLSVNDVSERTTRSSSTRNKRLFLSKNNPNPRVRGAAESTPKKTTRLTGVATKNVIDLEDDEDNDDDLDRLLNIQKKTDEQVEEEEVVTVEKEIKEDPDWIAPPPHTSTSRKSRKRQRAEAAKNLMDEVKQEQQVDPDMEIVMSKIAIKEEVEAENDECMIVLANYKVDRNPVDVETTPLPLKMIETDGEKLTHRTLHTRRVWNAVNHFFSSDPEKFSEIMLILDKDTERKGRVFKCRATVTNRTSPFPEKFINYLAKSPKQMPAELKDLIDFNRFSTALRERTSLLLNNHHVTPFLLHQLMEKFCEINRKFREAAKFGLTNVNDQENMIVAENAILGKYISSVMKITALSQVTWATGEHVKRRLELIYNGWRMFFGNGGFFRVLLALDRPDVKKMSPDFRSYCEEYLKDIDENYEKAVRLASIDTDQLMKEIMEKAEVTEEEVAQLDADLQVVESPSHTHKCSRCFLSCQQKVYFSSYDLLLLHEKLHDSAIGECGRCYNDFEGSEFVMHRIIEHFSLRPHNI